MGQQINLYNPALAPKVELITGRSALLVLAAIFAVCALAWTGVALDAGRLARGEKAQAAQLLQLKGEVASLSQQVAARKPSARLERDLADLEGLLSARNEVIALIRSGGLGDTRGVSEYFRAFARQTTDGLWLTGFSIGAAGEDIVIEGRTLDADLVPAYLRKLRRESALRGHGFESLAVYQPPQSAPAEGRKAGPPGYLEFRMATSQKDSATDLQASARPGGTR
jgi:hypothetical protein